MTDLCSCLKRNKRVAPKQGLQRNGRQAISAGRERELLLGTAPTRLALRRAQRWEDLGLGLRPIPGGGRGARGSGRRFHDGNWEINGSHQDLRTFNLSASLCLHMPASTLNCPI